MTGKITANICPLPPLYAEEGLTGEVSIETEAVGAGGLAIGGLEAAIAGVANEAPQTQPEHSVAASMPITAQEVEATDTDNLIQGILTVGEGGGSQVGVAEQQMLQVGREIPAQPKRRGGGRLRTTCLNHPERIAPGRARACGDCLAGVVPSVVQRQF